MTQQVGPPAPSLHITARVREAWNQLYDASSLEQMEAGSCAHLRRVVGAKFYIDRTAAPELVLTRTDSSTSFRCASTDVPVHTHPGIDLARCVQSPRDQETSFQRLFPAYVIICGRDAFVLYGTKWQPDGSVVLLARSETPQGRGMKREAIALTALSLGVTSNAVWHWDRDPGGYVDRPGIASNGPHLAISYVLTDACAAIGARPIVCSLSVIAAGAAFERTQGYVSRWDIRADVLGAGLGWLRHRLSDP